ESQKTGEQQIEETGCHGSKEPRWLFQVDACVPRNIQKLGKWVSRHPSTLGTGHMEIYWPRKQGTVKPRDPEALVSRNPGTNNPGGQVTLEPGNRLDEKPWLSR